MKKILSVLISFSMIFMCACINPIYGNENPSYLSDEEYLDIYNAAYAEKTNFYRSTYRDDKITMDLLRASIKTYTYSEYFKSVNGLLEMALFH